METNNKEKPETASDKMFFGDLWGDNPDDLDDLWGGDLVPPTETIEAGKSIRSLGWICPVCKRGCSPDAAYCNCNT